MDYLYHYYNDSDHHSTFPLVDQCLCPSSTFLLSVNILLLAILIYTLTIERVTFPVNSLNDSVSSLVPDFPSGSSSMVKVTRPKTLELLRLPDRQTEPSSVVTELLTTSTLCCPDDERSIALESTTIFNEPLASPSESHNSINSFGSSGSFKRKLIKPDFSLSFFDTSMSSTSLPSSDEDSRLLKVNEDDSLRDFNVLIHNGTEQEVHCNESTKSSS